jgi:hypothetical protein
MKDAATRDRAVFDDYVLRAGAAHLDADADRLFHRLRDLGFVGAKLEFLLATLYSAAFALRSQRERALLNSRKPLPPYAPVDDLHKHIERSDPELWRKIKAWRVWERKTNRERTDQIRRLAKAADEFAGLLGQVLNTPCLVVLVPSLATADAAELVTKAQTAARDARRDLTRSGGRSASSRMRRELLSPVLAAFIERTGTQHYEVIADALRLFTADLSKVSARTLRRIPPAAGN